MTDALIIDPAEAKARTLLEAAGVRGVTIQGSGDDWTVAIGWNEPERFVVAYSAKNPATPNDPVYLASQALATLIRNEGPCPHREQVNQSFHVESEPSQLELGAKLLADAGDEEQDSGHADVRPSDGNGDVEAALRAGDHAPDDAQGETEPSEPPETVEPAYGDGGRPAEAVGEVGGGDVPDEQPEPLVAELAPEPEAFAGTTILGADPLDRIRSQRIGDVARIAAGKIAERRAAASYTLAEYQELQGYVMSHTDAVGAFKGDDERYQRFVALADCQRAVNDLGAYRDGLTEALLEASREAVEAFDPAEGWPS